MMARFLRISPLGEREMCRRVLRSRRVRRALYVTVTGLLVFAEARLESHAQQAQIEQARQLNAAGALSTMRDPAEALALPTTAATYEDNSFGEQQFLKRV